jgi:DNA repair exonuclease SbcCD ATPase subunit
LKLREISWRNIGPYGNKLQKMNFSEGGGLWMVLGKNGHGKSFVVNLPKILYYGKLDGFRKEEIANRLNKHGWVRGEVETSPGTLVTIERHISPQDLRVFKYKAGEEPDEKNDIGKSGIANYQEYIDTEVTGLPYNIFSNIISLSVNDFKSFISMSPSDKRIIIDKLFAMEIINKMNDLVRKDLREAKINIDLYDREISSLNSSIKGALKELEKLRNKVKEDSTKKIKEVVQKMQDLKPKFETAQKTLIQYRQKKEEVAQARESFLTQKRNLESEIRQIQTKVDLYNQDKCPTCETPFTEKRFSLLKENLNEKLSTRQTSFEAIGASSEKYDIALVKLNESIGKINDYLLQAKSGYNMLANKLKELKDAKPDEFASIENIISKNTIQIKQREDEKLEEDKTHQYLSILETLYSDSGVKKKILESYLPTLNKEIEFTLSELHFPYSLKFNSDFEPKLDHLGIDINVETLSTGEKKRVDLSVLISIIRMLKRKYPSLNIFMLDEVLSSIDGDGIHDIIGLLQRTSKEMKMNIFIINHSPLPVEYFSFRVEIQKNAGFSDLVIEKLDDSLV